MLGGRTAERTYNRASNRLVPGTVQVFLGSQDRPSTLIEQFRSLMSVDEKARADRFKFEKDRRHFIAARGMLRSLLGGFLGIDPSEVRFTYSRYDKPSLSQEFQSTALKFNVSHSGGRALLAFACGRELGIDIELIRPDFATDDIAERFFSASEVTKLRSLPAEQQTDAFFTCWTRKEAFIKAIGEGLSCPLDKFDVTLGPDEPASLLATRVDGQPASKWSMRALDAGEGYKAAIVVEGHDWDLTARSWEDATA